MKHSAFICGDITGVNGIPRQKSSLGFTLVELMIVTVIIAVAITLIAPTFKSMLTKRHLKSTVIEISSFIGFTQSEAIKQKRSVTVSWASSARGDNWCIGASVPPQNVPCNCMETDSDRSDFCSINGASYRLVQSDFVDKEIEFIHWFPEDGNFSFEPVHGVMNRLSSNDILSAGKPLVNFRSYERTGALRSYELELNINRSGQVEICTDDYRKSIVSGYEEC